MPMSPPTSHELETLPRVTMTSPQPWDPSPLIHRSLKPILRYLHHQTLQMKVILILLCLEQLLTHLQS